MRGPHAAWRAWTDAERIWFLIGRVEQQDLIAKQPAELALLFFSSNGEPVASGAWRLDPTGKWVLNRILEPGEFLPQHGGQERNLRRESPGHAPVSDSTYGTRPALAVLA